MFQRNRGSKGHPGILGQSHVLQNNSHELQFLLRSYRRGTGWVFYSVSRGTRVQFPFGHFHPLTHVSHPIGESLPQSEMLLMDFSRKCSVKELAPFWGPWCCKTHHVTDGPKWSMHTYPSWFVTQKVPRVQVRFFSDKQTGPPLNQNMYHFLLCGQINGTTSPPAVGDPWLLFQLHR